VDVSTIIAELREQPIPNSGHVPTQYATDLPTFMDWTASILANHDRAFHRVSKLCKSCEYRASAGDSQGSGVHECWQLAIERGLLRTALDPTNRELPLTVDLWGGKGGSVSPVERLLDKRRAFLADVTEDDLPASKSARRAPGLSGRERRLAQVEAARGGSAITLSEDALAEMDAWVWPLHLIDFETSAPAIPFFAGMRPYQKLAFQFSHHMLTRAVDGSIRVIHANQWISTEANAYPNVEFVRALKSALAPNANFKGTVFRYHNHENSVLRDLLQEIENKGSEIPDASELIAFLLDITSPTMNDRKCGDHRDGSNAMVDLHSLVERGYYSNRSGGSVSLKAVLPSILGDAPLTARLFQQPGLYGLGLPMSSLNFTDPGGHVWLPDGSTGDPYKTLPPIAAGFGDDVDEMLARFSASNHDNPDVIDQGGIAMLAYNLTQFIELTDAGRSAVRDALLRYCELDTLAMAILILGLMELRGHPLNVDLSTEAK